MDDICPGMSQVRESVAWESRPHHNQPLCKTARKATKPCVSQRSMRLERSGAELCGVLPDEEAERLVEAGRGADAHDAWAELAALHMKADRPHEAMFHFEAALQADPTEHVSAASACCARLDFEGQTAWTCRTLKHRVALLCSQETQEKYDR